MAVGRGGVRGGDKEGEQENGRRAGGEGGTGQRATEGKKQGGRKGGSGEERRKGQVREGFTARQPALLFLSFPLSLSPYEPQT